MNYPRFRVDQLKTKLSEIEPGVDPDLIAIEKETKKEEIRERNRLKKWILRIFTCTGAVVVVTYIWHIIMPLSWRWLDPQEVTSIKDLALSISTGVIISFATKFTVK